LLPDWNRKKDSEFPPPTPLAGTVWEGAGLVCVPALWRSPEFCFSIPELHGGKNADPEPFSYHRPCEKRAREELVCPGGVGPENPRDRTSFPDTLGDISPESAVAGPKSGNSGEGWRFLGTEADASIFRTMGIIAAPAYVSMGIPESCFPISELYGRWDAETPSAESSLGSFGEGAGLACSGTEGRVGPENPGDRTPFPDTLGNLSPESAPFGPKSRDSGEGWGFSGMGEGGGVVPAVGMHAAPEPVGSASPECCSTVSGLYGKWEVSFSPLAPLLGECEGEVGLLLSGTKTGTVPERVSLGRVAGNVSTRESCAV